MRYNILKFDSFWVNLSEKNRCGSWVVKIYENQQKGTEKGGATYVKAYEGRPISAHHDTPWALSAVDVS